MKLYDADTRQIILQRSAICHGDSPMFYNDDRHVVWGEVWQTRAPPWLPRWIAKWIFIDRDQARQVVVETQTGRLIHSVPGTRFIGFGPNAATFWTVNRFEGNSEHVVFRQYPTEAPAPPWWLWLLTALGAVAIVWDTKKRRHSVSRVA
ncbi:MAG: hypothetical protein ACJ8C4_21630 [Gemmataceae bacterium]